MSNEIRVSRNGSKDALESYLGAASPPSGFTLHLYQGDITPSELDATSLYTSNECNFSGYLAQSIVSWGAGGVVSGRVVSTAPDHTFTVASSPSTTNDVYGYYVTNDDTGEWAWAQRFVGAPIPMALGGDSIVITPTRSERSEFT